MGSTTEASGNVGWAACQLNEVLVDALTQLSLLLGRLAAPGLAEPELPQPEAGAEPDVHLIRQLLVYGGLQEVWRQGPIDLQVNLAPDLPPVWGDWEGLERLIIILLTNAVEAAHLGGGKITVATSRQVLPGVAGGRRYLGEAQLAPGRYVCLTVSDDGPGIDSAARAHLFKPFFSTKAAGRGLGLYDLLYLVQVYCGAVEVVSRLGEGATFNILLPAHERAFLS